MSTANPAGRVSRGGYRIGIDTGGTFTDFVLHDGVALRTHKELSTPDAPERAILAGLRAFMSLGPVSLGIPP